jgi:hypothetical protein
LLGFALFVLGTGIAMATGRADRTSVAAAAASAA